MKPKSLMPAALSPIYKWLKEYQFGLRSQLISSTTLLEWCYIHSIRDSYITLIIRIIWPYNSPMELFFNAKLDFRSTKFGDPATAHHTHPVCQSSADDSAKMTNVWQNILRTNRIIDNQHLCLGGNVISWVPFLFIRRGKCLPKSRY